MNLTLLGALGSLLLWIVLAFVTAIQSGWVHLLLIAAVLLFAKTIMDDKRA